MIYAQHPGKVVEPVQSVHNGQFSETVHIPHESHHNHTNRTFLTKSGWVYVMWEVSEIVGTEELSDFITYVGQDGSGLYVTVDLFVTKSAAMDSYAGTLSLLHKLGDTSAFLVDLTATPTFPSQPE